MAKWWKFGFGKESEEPQPEPEGAPEEAPKAPEAEAPEPEAEAPEPTPEAPESKKPGFFSRLFGRKKKEAPPEEAPPEEVPTEEEKLLPLFPEEGEEAGGPPPAAPRVYPPYLHVSADGKWRISDTEWEGTMSGTLHGADVKRFIDAMEDPNGPDYKTAIPLIADAYGIPSGLINVERSTIYSVTY
ncbi:hypothetical protein ACFU98_44370 [Streptomyces sp. NPDC057575]|uniref:hypothetical protein n=1 Tax=unclassified Streptomyces TaxID=2593676 RepID=UPI00367B0544